MRTLETRVEGDPEALEAYAAWIRGRACAAARRAAAEVADAAAAGRAWHGLSGYVFVGRAGDLADRLEAVAAQADRTADAVSRHAGELRAAQEAVEAVRRRAAAAGLHVAGTVVTEAAPAAVGPVPSVLPWMPGGEELLLARAAQEARSAAFDEAEAEVRRVRSHLEGAVAETCARVDDYRGLVGDQWAFLGMQVSADLVGGSASATSRNLRLPPASADALAEADRLAREAAAMAKGAGGLLFALNVVNDLRAGESVAQAATSNAVGAAAGTGAIWATTTAFAAGGSAVGPIGTAAGALVGATVGVFASGAVDRMWKERGGVVDALEGGARAVGDTVVAAGEAVADGMTHVADEVVEGAEDLVDAAGAVWSWAEDLAGT